MGTSNSKAIILSKCAICGNEKSRFIKNQEAKELLSNLDLRILLSKVLILGDILFWDYKMNEIVNKILLASDNFMPEMHLRQQGFSYSTCEPLTKKQRKNLKI